MLEQVFLKRVRKAFQNWRDYSSFCEVKIDVNENGPIVEQVLE